MKYVAIWIDKHGNIDVVAGSDKEEYLLNEIESEYEDDIISFADNVFELEGDERIEVIAVPWLHSERSLPEDFGSECNLLPVAGSEMTADPIWLLCDHDIVIPDVAHDAMLSDDRIAVSEDGDNVIFDAESGEPLSDQWLVENGYAVRIPRYYGVYMSRESANEAIKARPYAFNDPKVYCESLVYSDPALKWFTRMLHQRKKEQK